MRMKEQPIEIRTATVDDVSAIVELSHALFQEDAGQHDPLTNLEWAHQHGAEHYGKLVARESSVCLVALADGVAVGYLAGYTYGPSDVRPIVGAELESLFVYSEWRGRQIGT